LINILESNIKINGQIFAYDYNKNLIRLYNDIKYNVDKVIKNIDKYMLIYNDIKTFNGNKKPNNQNEYKSSKESYYYFMREKFNTLNESIEKSALFIILNKLGFRGVYRESSSGRFNVPFGNYKNSNIYEKENLLELSQNFQKVIFQNMDFKDSLNTVKNNDFVYADPPYAPENSKSFVAYNKEGFTIDDNLILFEKLKNLNTKFLMSNSCVDFVKKNFNDNYTLIEVDAKRSINSKNPESKTKELLIKNY
jgi:DNA adenine methylase